jgi:hypothetical protein
MHAARHVRCGTRNSSQTLEAQYSATAQTACHSAQRTSPAATLAAAAFSRASTAAIAWSPASNSSWHLLSSTLHFHSMPAAALYTVDIKALHDHLCLVHLHLAVSMCSNARQVAQRARLVSYMQEACNDGYRP